MKHKTFNSRNKGTNKAFNIDKRRGRKIVVNRTNYKWSISRSGGIVILSEHGKRFLTKAWIVLGYNDPNLWHDNMWDRSKYASVTPSKIAEWISKNV